jgi:hypothetical protein
MQPTREQAQPPEKQNSHRNRKFRFSGVSLYSRISFLIPGSQITGLLILIASLFLAATNVFSGNIMGHWKWPIGVAMAGVSLLGALGVNADRSADAKKALFWPLTFSLISGTAIFAGRQILTEVGYLSQNTGGALLKAQALHDLPLFFWTIFVGIFWVWSSASFATERDSITGAWFGWWEKNPVLVWTTLGIIIGWGALVRVWNLGRLGLWMDEGTVYIVAKNIILTGVPYLETKLLYLRDLPHLYTVAGALWLFKDIEFGIRLPSIICGVLLIPVTFFLAQKVFNQKSISLLAAAIVAFHPWMIEYSRLGRSYMMMLFWLYLAALFLQTALTSRWSRVGLAIACFLATTTHGGPNC